VKAGAYTAAVAVAVQTTILHSVFPRKCNRELRMALSAAVSQAHAFSSYVTLALFMLVELHLMVPFVAFRHLLLCSGPAICGVSHTDKEEEVT
jgi:hypothetical protein